MAAQRSGGMASADEYHCVQLPRCSCSLPAPLPSLFLHKGLQSCMHPCGSGLQQKARMSCGVAGKQADGQHYG